VGKRSDVISDGDGKPCEGQRKIKIEAVSIDNLVFHLKTGFTFLSTYRIVA
jgi:hypothetical protein